jgi:hypothetical protein
MDIDWNAVMAAEGFSTWIRIMIWVWVACVIWLFVVLLRGGFTDMTEVITSRYATAGERSRMMMRLPTRFLLLVVAACSAAPASPSRSLSRARWCCSSGDKPQADKQNPASQRRRGLSASGVLAYAAPAFRLGKTQSGRGKWQV